MKNLRKLLYLLQLEEYQTGRYYKWLEKNKIDFLEERKKKLFFTPRIILTLPVSLLFLPFLGQEKAVGVSNKIIGVVFKLLEEIIVFLAKVKLYFHPKLKRMVITGSYGKTTFKEKLSFVLEKKYDVLKTPGNINTRVGIASLILKNLSKKHQVLIVEAGAYKKGEIRKICELVRPDYGAITIFGWMHLERFGSLKNIKEAKSELIPFISDKNNLFVPKLSHSFIDFDKTIEKIGSSMKISLKDIRERLGNFPGVAHRVEEKKENKNILVIDDSYNSNPLGFKRAVDKLKGYKGQKILITPGMIELGKEQYRLNFEAAQYAANFVDIFVIVGDTNKKALWRGANSAKNKDLKILFADSKSNIQDWLMPHIRPPAVILIENELPDHYF